MRSVLPRGRTLPPRVWERRHKAILAILWLHVVVIPAYGLTRYDVWHSALHALPLAAFALLGTLPLARRTRTSMVALGLLSASALLVHESGGLIEAHFHFFVMIIVLTLYEDWIAFLLAVGFVLLHHGLVGGLFPGGVFDHVAAQAHPWRWAAIHAGFVAAAGAAAVTAWRLNEDVRGETEHALRVARLNEERFRRSFDDAAIGMALTTIDGTFLRVNRSLCEMLGYGEERLVGRRFQEFTHPDDSDVSYAARDALEGDDRQLRFDKRYIRSGGETIWVSLAATLIEPHAEEPYYIAQVEDITVRKRAEEQALRAEARARRRESQQAALAALGQRALAGGDFQTLCEHALELVTGAFGAPYARVTGVGADGPWHIALVGWPAVIAAADSAQPAYTVRAGRPVMVEDASAEDRFDTFALRSLAVESGMSVAFGEHESDETYVLDVHSRERRAFTADDLNFLQAVGNVLGGAVERERGERELRHRSLHDPLTGLPNRLLFLDRLQHALNSAERTGETIALLFLDLDEFKVVNDGFGHEVGDALLRTLGGRLASVLRDCDTLGRFGGDEFVVLCEDLNDPADAVAVAERMRAALAEPLELGGARHVAAASIGVATATGEYPGGFEGLMRDADAAMYRAKESGGDRYEIFDDVMRARLADRLAIERGLPLALERGEFRLVFQPLVSLEDGRARRCEALLRWEHPERGLVPPGAFIEIAEASGAIVAVGEWVLHEACRWIARWRAAAAHPDLAELRVGVNVSARQLTRAGFPDTVAHALEQSGLDPDALLLEITETALIDDPDRAEDTICRLRALGVGVALDDFGTGYSSLSSIKRYRLSAVKLDRSFVDGLEAGSHDAAIVRAVVDMASAIGIRTVGEGVESAEQLRQLHELGCDTVQGYFFSRPVDPAEFERLVRADFAKPMLAAALDRPRPLRIAG